MEGDFDTTGLADPVLLHQLHFGGPVVQIVDRVQQFPGIVTDFEEPLRQLATFDFGTRAPAFAVNHLFVGQNGHIDRVPVHDGFLAINQAFLEKIDEHRLLKAIIIGIAGRQFAGPIQRPAHRLHLRFHVGDVAVGPSAGVAATIHCGVFCSKTKGIPAHGVQHVVSGGSHIARDHVSHRIVPHVADVDSPRWIGKHLQHIVFRLRFVAFGDECASFVPAGLPFRFDGLGIVVGHARSSENVPRLIKGL